VTPLRGEPRQLYRVYGEDELAARDASMVDQSPATDELPTADESQAGDRQERPDCDNAWWTWERLEDLEPLAARFSKPRRRAGGGRASVCVLVAVAVAVSAIAAHALRAMLERGGARTVALHDRRAAGARLAVVRARNVHHEPRSFDAAKRHAEPERVADASRRLDASRREHRGEARSALALPSKESDSLEVGRQAGAPTVAVEVASAYPEQPRGPGRARREFGFER
jgi:hypothetical protein